MKRANRLMLVFGATLAIVSFVAVLALGAFGQQAAAPDPEVTVVTAAADLALGTQITAEQLATSTRPLSQAQDTYERPEDVVGLVVRQPIVAGQALAPSDFDTTAAVPELAQALAPGRRAVAVAINSTDSIGTLLQPGDFVDVIIALEEIDGLNPVSVENPGAGVPTSDGSVIPPYTLIDDVVNNTSVKVVVQNVQVLATVDQYPDSADVNDEEAPPVEGAPDMLLVLSVTPQQAEVVRFAELDGNISVVLRAPADYAAGDTPTSGITLKELVDNWGVLPPQPITP